MGLSVAAVKLPNYEITHLPNSFSVSPCLRGRFSEPVPLPTPRRDSGLRRFHPQIRCCSSHFPERKPSRGALRRQLRILPHETPSSQAGSSNSKTAAGIPFLFPAGGKLMHVLWWII